jgi:tRNA G10  N-methylase Trm11
MKQYGLRSTTCADIIQAVFISEKECFIENKFTIVLDPFCGKSSILTEWLFTNYVKKDNIFFCSDADCQQIQISKENLQTYNKNERFDLILTNLHEKSILPYRNDCIDLIVSDLPFGLNFLRMFFSKNTVNNLADRFYEKILSEFSRVLIKQNGVLVLLVNKKDSFIFESKVFDQEKGFKIILKETLCLGRTYANLYKLINR